MRDKQSPLPSMVSVYLNACESMGVYLSGCVCMSLYMFLCVSFAAIPLCLFFLHVGVVCWGWGNVHLYLSLLYALFPYTFVGFLCVFTKFMLFLSEGEFLSSMVGVLLCASVCYFIHLCVCFVCVFTTTFM